MGSSLSWASKRGTKALCLYSQAPQAYKPICRADLADSSLDGVEHHPGSRVMADIVSVTMTLLSIKDLAVVTSTGPEPAEDDLLL